MSKKKNAHTAGHTAVVQLDVPLHRHSGEELVQVNRQQMDRIKLALDFPTQPAVQAAVAALAASTDTLDKKLSAIQTKRAEIDVLIQERDVGLSDVARDRDALRATISVVSKGSPDAIKAWNCAVQTKRADAPVSLLAPTGLHLRNSATAPGTVKAKCKATRGGASYAFAFTTDPAAPPGSGAVVTTTRSQCDITGQTPGHVLYARVAVTRAGGGQSAWSDPAQILVR